jgi:hypothetical protein
LATFVKNAHYYDTTATPSRGAGLRPGLQNLRGSPQKTKIPITKSEPGASLLVIVPQFFQRSCRFAVFFLPLSPLGKLNLSLLAGAAFVMFKCRGTVMSLESEWEANRRTVRGERQRLSAPDPRLQVTNATTGFGLFVVSISSIQCAVLSREKINVLTAAGVVAGVTGLAALVVSSKRERLKAVLAGVCWASLAFDTAGSFLYQTGVRMESSAAAVGAFLAGAATVALHVLPREHAISLIDLFFWSSLGLAFHAIPANIMLRGFEAAEPLVFSLISTALLTTTTSIVADTSYDSAFSRLSTPCNVAAPLLLSAAALSARVVPTTVTQLLLSASVTFSAGAMLANRQRSRRMARVPNPESAFDARLTSVTEVACAAVAFSGIYALRCQEGGRGLW